MTVRFRLPRLYERRTDTMNQHAASRAIVTSSRYASHYSTFGGGVTEYVNAIEVNLGLVFIRHSWTTSEFGHGA